MKTIVTRQSYTKRQEQHDLYEKRISDAIEDKEEAKSQGDLSENFGYVEALKAIENFRRMQTELGLKAPGVESVDPFSWCELEMDDEPRARLGALVTIERNGDKQTFLIGGAWDSDLDLDQDGVVPYTSPLARALIPKAPGHRTILETSGEEILLLSAQTPTKEDIGRLYGIPLKKAPPAQTLAGPEM